MPIFFVASGRCRPPSTGPGLNRGHGCARDHLPSSPGLAILGCLDTFATQGHLGGRTAVGYGRITAEITTTSAGAPAAVDCRATVAAERDDAIAALNTLI